MESGEMVPPFSRVYREYRRVRSEFEGIFGLQTSEGIKKRITVEDGLVYV
jgi:hypothetical protein